MVAGLRAISLPTRHILRTPAIIVHLLLASLHAFAEPAAPAMQTIGIPMRDGAVLATDIYMPHDFSGEKYAGGVPVILVRTPYNKDREGPTGRWRECFLGNGYAFAIQDMRGFHASASAGGGTPRRFDGYDTVEWLARQPWCNGKVGMMGYSHPGAGTGQ